MKWLTPFGREHISTSEDGQYEIRGAYVGNAFAWRGRRIDTDRLVASSADRNFVEQRCEWDAAAALAEAG